MCHATSSTMPYSLVFHLDWSFVITFDINDNYKLNFPTLGTFYLYLIDIKTNFKGCLVVLTRKLTGNIEAKPYLFATSSRMNLNHSIN